MRRSVLVALLSSVFAIAFHAQPALCADFQHGDLYLLSQALPGPGGTYHPGIVHIDPNTGFSTLVYPGNNRLNTFSLVYDPFRDKLLFTVADSLVGMDPSGTVTKLRTFVSIPGAFYPGALASRGDGIIYIQVGTDFRYLDAANAEHPLLNEAGTATFTLGGPNSIREMRYDETTNSLIVFAVGGTIAPCPDASQACAAKIPLDAAGTQVAGPVVGSQVEVSASGETPVGSGVGPNTLILMVIDTNSNNAEDRMLLLDPSSMAFSDFATNGPYVGAGGTNAGTYSSVRQAAIILDTLANALREYTLGSSGLGTIFSDAGTGYGLSGSGSGEQARLAEVLLTPTAVRSPAPQGLLLEVPYPNPFNPSTNIRFHLARESTVRLDVFDVRGRLVRTLIDGRRGAGWQQSAWDGVNAHGSRVASGVYFVRLTSQGELQTRRFVLVR